MTKASDISIQFYASPVELREFIQRIIDDRTAYATVVKNAPFHMHTLDSIELEALVDGTAPCRIYFTLEKPAECVAKQEFEAIVSNPLVLDVGHLDKSGLHQSWLACRVSDQQTINAWRRVAKLLKEATEEGIVATNRDNGISHYYKSFRHTMGARTLQEQGVEIVPIQGVKGPRMRLGKSSH